MADWEDRRDFYLRQGRLNEQLHEDMLAARVLQGLGVKRARNPATLGWVEQAVLGTNRRSLPAWPRAQEIFMHLIRASPHCHWAQLWKPQAALIVDHTVALEMMSTQVWELHVERPLLFTRKKNTELCYVYTFWKPEELNSIKPPFKVYPADGYPERLFTQQEAVHFVEQFGPYYVNVDGD